MPNLRFCDLPTPLMDTLVVLLLARTDRMLLLLSQGERAGVCDRSEQPS